MYTRCTYCDAWLRITAAQLRSGLGDVRCGDCMQVFNALVHLDDALPDGSSEPPTPPNLGAGSRPMFRLEEAPDSAAVRMPAAAGGVEAAAARPEPGQVHGHGPDGNGAARGTAARDGDDPVATLAPMRAMPEDQLGAQTAASPAPSEGGPIAVAPDANPTGESSDGRVDSAAAALSPAGETPVAPVSRADSSPSDAALATPPTGAAVPVAQAPRAAVEAPVAERTDGESAVVGGAGRTRETPIVAAVDPGLSFDGPVPDVLREDVERLRRRRSPLRRALLTMLAALLLLGLPLQYAWFMPDDLASRYPLAAPHVARFCALSGCRLAELGSQPRIRLVGRDVRIHPRYEGALEVVAVIVNEAARPRRFPDIRFTLFNVNGDVLGSRRFQPAQYLQARPPDVAGMPPGEAIDVRLELIAPEDTAVSFEFEFI